MPISRSRLRFLGQRISSAVSDVVLPAACRTPRAKIAQVYPDDGDTLVSEAQVSTEVTLGTIERAKLFEAREAINELLEKCADDKDFG